VVSTRMDELVSLRSQFEAKGEDLLREMVRSFAQGLMFAEADVAWGRAESGLGESPLRVPDPPVGHTGGLHPIGWV